MELESALYEWAKAQATLTAILGADPGFRFHKLRIPQGGITPASVQQRSGTSRQYRGCTVDGAVAISLQLDHYAKTTNGRDALASAWRRALSPDNLPYPVLIGGDSPGEAVKVKAATLDNEFDLDDPEPGLLRRSQLWTFWVFESSQA